MSLTVAALLWANQYQGQCFQQHLKEAFQVNLSRGKVYALMTGGRSWPITAAITILDKMGTPFAIYFDQKFKDHLGTSGLDLVCETIPSVKPNLKRPFRSATLSESLVHLPFDLAGFQNRLERSYQKGGLKLAQAAIQSELKKLDRSPSTHCLARQFVASMNRLISVTLRMPKSARASEAKKDTWRLIQATMIQLKALTVIDEMAVPFQKAGIPIICNEIPEIPRF